MAKANLASMSIDSLLKLREDIGKVLSRRANELKNQLSRLGAEIVPRSRASSLRGREVPPKYRSPSGETWAGRGARPLWLVEALKRGRKIEHFLIDKSARKVKRRRAKR